MSPNVPPVFEALPAEVLGNILRQMASPDDLYSTIRASPSAFGSFLCFREAILVEVLQAHLPAEIFAEYLGLLHIPKYEDFNYVPKKRDFENWPHHDQSPKSRLCAWEACRYEAWPEIIRGFFHAHFEHVRAAKSSGVQKYSIPSPADAKHINYIASMNGTVKRFIRDYQSFVRYIGAEDFPPLASLEPPSPHEESLLPQNWPQLSVSETLRLQRGFLRYELCCRLYGCPAWDATISQRDGYYVEPSLEVLSGYIERWEEEEIRCTWTYVHRQYQVLGREVLAEYRSDVRRLRRKARQAPDHEVTRVPNIFSKEYVNDFKKWTYNMSCLGLPMLQQLLRSEFDDQRLFLKNTLFKLYPKFEGMLFLPKTNDWILSSVPGLTSMNRPTEDGFNPVYESVANALRSWSSDFHDGRRLKQIETRIKEVGWVFWEDRQRLEKLELLSRRFGDVPLFSGMMPMRFDAEHAYPELTMCVTKEDYERELSAKYPVNPPVDGGEQFLCDRLRDISDWSSMEVSPAFREICLGMPTSE